ncbi:hypothetical protein SAMN04487894_1325 [Niabella drilacis]|uniref:Uncharacterized protein n=1 Tax=Niabella drilacis (strain DSM 25811 / CCM 8410 / CCUG 62505 / LMG 26954 / E90) TaxID=1285928 RepID=A0A1G7BPK1_NIADE|nr:hypothetical protein SAMN04487894_1325 [Niabella drilacis]
MGRRGDSTCFCLAYFAAGAAMLLCKYTDAVFCILVFSLVMQKHADDPAFSTPRMWEPPIPSYKAIHFYSGQPYARLRKLLYKTGERYFLGQAKFLAQPVPGYFHAL